MLKNKHKGTFCIESAEKVQKMLFMCVFECNKTESIRESESIGYHTKGTQRKHPTFKNSGNRPTDTTRHYNLVKISKAALHYNRPILYLCGIGKHCGIS